MTDQPVLPDEHARRVAEMRDPIREALTRYSGVDIDAEDGLRLYDRMEADLCELGSEAIPRLRVEVQRLLARLNVVEAERDAAQRWSAAWKAAAHNYRVLYDEAVARGCADRDFWMQQARDAQAAHARYTSLSNAEAARIFTEAQDMRAARDAALARVTAAELALAEVRGQGDGRES